MMSRATGVYVLMILIFGAGLWTVLSFGSLLDAPEDFDGTWDLIPADSPRSDTAFSGPLLIEQSGVYVNLNFASGERVPVKQSRRPRNPEAEKDPDTAVHMKNDQWEFIIEGLRGSHERQMTLFGPGKYVWTAHRRGPGEEEASPMTGPQPAPLPTTQPATAVHAR